MNISEAANYQDSFDAVASGAASPAQCTEVRAVVQSLRSYLQEADLRAQSIPDRIGGFLAILDPAIAAKVQALLPLDGAPRLDIDPDTGVVDTPANLVVAAAARAAALEPRPGPVQAAAVDRSA